MSAIDDLNTAIKDLEVAATNAIGLLQGSVPSTQVAAAAVQIQNVTAALTAATTPPVTP